MVRIFQQIKHESGIPLGGIGAGTVEIRPDGLFHEWHIFNKGQWSPTSPCSGKDVPLPPPDNMVFLVRTKTPSGKITVRYLALREQLQELYSFPWAKCVEGILFDGQFPVARLFYEDDDLPIRVQAEIFAPFVPNDSRVSATPGFYVHFIAHNLTEAPLEVSFLGIMANFVGHGQDKRTARNRLERDGDAVTIVLGADGLGKKECTTGDMTFSVSGGETSFVTSSLRGCSSFRTWNTLYGFKVSSYLNSFRKNGKLPNLSGETAPSMPNWPGAAKLSPEQRQETLDDLLTYSFIYEYLHSVSASIPNIGEDQDQLISFLDDMATLLNEFGKAESGEAALCTRLELKPDAKQSALFTVGWFFPNHISETGANLGHKYENWFGSALDVSKYLNANYRSFREKTLMVAEQIYNSSLDQACADAVSSQLSTLTKCTWWTKSGDFGVWEGLGCCGFHTTDITYQGSFPIIALFPDLQKTQMKLGAKFQREDGRVHHFFTPDFSAVDDSFERVDMNQQFVMLAARDYLWTGDREYLEQLWPNIVRAMDNTALLDTDGDGLPDHDTRRNTYDVWDFAGCPSYIASLWLGALKAAIRLAEEMKDPDRAAKWKEIYTLGVVSFESKLWNGKYYVLWKDEKTGQVDECCMSDQISGDWFCGIMGWGNICKPERIRKVLSNVMKFNFSPDTGLINASYPPGVPERQPTAGNMQAQAPWTGIEYTVAALLIQNGMLGDGLAVVQDIHDRYLQAGRFWNHVECGGHYYRALSSWTVLLALSGFRLDVPKNKIAFAPAVESDSCSYPFFAPNVTGIYRQTSGLAGTSVVLNILSGSVDVGTIELPKLSVADNPIAVLNGQNVQHTVSESKTAMRISFDPVLILNAGDEFTVA